MRRVWKCGGFVSSGRSYRGYIIRWQTPFRRVPTAARGSLISSFTPPPTVRVLELSRLPRPRSRRGGTTRDARAHCLVNALGTEL